MFSDKFNQQIRQWMEGAASPFVRYKISANAITTAGAVLAVLAAIFIYLQIWWLACLIYFLSGCTGDTILIMRSTNGTPTNTIQGTRESVRISVR